MAMDKVREELICAVCLDFLREPKVLQCAHSYCCQCLRKVAEASREQSRCRAAQVSSTSSSTAPTAARRSLELECPSCRHITVLEHGRVELDLPTNVNLKRLVEIVSDEEKGRTLKILQRRSTVRARLKTSSDRVPQCRTHHQPLDWFCRDCNEMVCQSCCSNTSSSSSTNTTSTGNRNGWSGSHHTGHTHCSMNELEVMLREKAVTLRSLIQPACEVTAIADRQMQVLYQDRDTVVTNSNTTREAVTEFFRDLRQALDQRERAILNTLQKYTDVKLSTLDLHHQKLQEDHMAITATVESLEKLLHVNEGMLDPSLLSSSKPLEDELELHQNSVLSVADGLEEAKYAARFLSFSGDEILLTETLREAGVLNECQRIPDTNILSIQHVVVSEQEDPYLLVPSRFEDLLASGPQEEVRIDGRKKSQRVMKMSDMVEDNDIQYQLPREFITSSTEATSSTSVRSLAEGLFQKLPPSPLKKVKQTRAQNGKVVSPATIDCTPTPEKKSHENQQPPLPPRQSGRKPPTPPLRRRSTKLKNAPPPLPPKNEDIYSVPRSVLEEGVSGPYDTYDVPRQLMQGHSSPKDDEDDYVLPPPELHFEESTYDVPRKFLSPSSPLLLSPSHSCYQELHKIHTDQPNDDVYDVPKSVIALTPPPRPPKPSTSTSTASSSSSSSPIPPGEEFPAGIIPPRVTPPKPKPRTNSMSANFNYINTNIIIPEDKAQIVLPSPRPVRKQPQTLLQPQSLMPCSESSPDFRTKPIPAPRPVKRAHTVKEIPQSAPPVQTQRARFQWNGEPHSVDNSEKFMSSLPKNIKLQRENNGGGGGGFGHRKPYTIFTAQHLAKPLNDDQVYPCGVCCSPSTGLLVVTDVYNHCVKLVDPKTGLAINRIGKEGRSGGNFKEPSAVVMDKNEHIFVTELDNPRVQKFTSRGQYLLKFGQKAFWGSQLHDPYGLALSPDGTRLYITDWEKGRILIYDKEGRHISTIGKDHAFLKFPAGLVFDRQGNLLVTDRGKHCVWVMSPEGKPINRIGKFGSGEGELLLPHGIAVLNNDSIAVSECGNHRVSIFSPNGQFICSFGQKGTEPGMFHYPRHMCVDSRGRLVVTDEHNQRIQIFDV